MTKEGLKLKEHLSKLVMELRKYAFHSSSLSGDIEILALDIEKAVDQVVSQIQALGGPVTLDDDDNEEDMLILKSEVLALLEDSGSDSKEAKQ